MLSDLLLGGRWLLAVVLIVAGVEKMHPSARDRTAQAIRDYGLVPERWAEATANLLPWFEIGCGLLICAGAALAITASLISVMMGCFAIAVGRHVALGHAFDCGCGSAATPISWGLAGRDLAFCLLSLAIAVGPSGALAVWPGWGSSHVHGSAAAVIPVPLITILALAGLRLAMGARHARGQRRPLRRQTGAN